MANPREEPEAINGRVQENNVISQAEFRTFQHETQQALQAIQATLARLNTGVNQQREEERIREYHGGRIDRAHGHHPIPRGQLAPEEELSDDEEYAERLAIGLCKFMWRNSTDYRLATIYWRQTPNKSLDLWEDYVGIYKTGCPCTPYTL
uniref:Uncharacterized protein n=1 Tax=Salix viminalis TaxID=40686 RepID=A0A6N2M7L2_SALVM